MTPGSVAALAVSVLALLIAAITVFALWFDTEPHRGRRRRHRNATLPIPQHWPSDVDDEEHDWDGWLRELTGPVVGDEYEARPAEKAIEIPREGTGETPWSSR